MNKEKVILCSIPDENDATSWYRAMGPLGHLRRHSKNPISYSILMDRFGWSNLSLCDLVFVQRPTAQYHLDLIKMAKLLKKPVWIDFDDNLLAVPQSNPTFAIYGMPDSKARVKEILELADVVSVSTEALKNQLKEHNQNIHVIENALDLDIFEKKETVWGNYNNLVIWRGSPSHTKDVLSVASDFVSVVNNTSNFDFAFWGDPQWLITEHMNTERISFIAPQRIPEFFFSFIDKKPKVVVVPLHNSAFNQAKSNIAWLEATVSGAVCVAPNMPEWEQPGLIRYLSKPKCTFGECLKSALRLSKQEHYALLSESWEKIHSYYNLDIQNEKREQLIESLL